MSDQPKEKIFVDGMNVKLPSSKAPDYILLQLGFNSVKFFRWLQQHQDDKGWVNVTIKKSKTGNIYAELDTWKPHIESRGIPSLADVHEVKERRDFTPDITLENIDSEIPF